VPTFSKPPSARERARLLAGLSAPVVEAARFLLGHVLVRRQGRSVLPVRIVETEAYLGENDPAAHSYRGRTKRTEPIWGPPGTVYVYFIYGMHYCLNVAVERRGVPGCVLIRAADPLPESGLDSGDCRGPGRLCRALALDTAWSGRYLFEPQAALYLREGDPPAAIAVSPRIGIRQAADRPLRFYDPASAAVSGPGPLRVRAPARTVRGMTGGNG